MSTDCKIEPRHPLIPDVRRRQHDLELAITSLSSCMEMAQIELDTYSQLIMPA